jgi:N-acylneuraminate cytidylyltransferase
VKPNAVAIIPARGGSKRIPGKNIREFFGRPMMAWSIAAACESGLFRRVIVSTDSVEIAEAARTWGAEAPFMRPAELAGDMASTEAVVEHALQWLDAAGDMPDFACCIYPTAPFVRAEFLRQGLELLSGSDAVSVFSITTFAFPIQRALRIEEGGGLSMMWPEYEMSRSQDLPEAYHDAGQFYWLRSAEFLREGRMYSSRSLPVLVPRWLVQDIDTLEDWKRAELMFEVLRREGEQG